MQLTFVSRKQETPTIYSFVFELKGPVRFEAGQLIRITVPHPNPDNRGIARIFSISSSPTEKFIMVTTRIIKGGSTFKKALLALPLESEVEGEGPFGSFVLLKNQNPCLFITGGVGITPVRSMLKYATDKKLPNRLVLLYSNVTPEEIAFYNFLNELQTHNPASPAGGPKLDIIYTITKLEAVPAGRQESKISWSGEVGRIDKALVQKNLQDEENTLFYISGPVSLVEDFFLLLKEMGIPQERIKRENFPGY